jgi:acetylserotonin N-methyltransferase
MPDRSPTRDPVDQLSEILLSQWHFPAFAVSHRLGLTAALTRQALTADQAASAVGAGVAAIEPLLEMLVSLKICRYDDGRYAVADGLADLVGGQGEGDWGPVVDLAWDQRCGVLLESVRTGRPRLFSRGLYESMAAADWLCRRFTASMHARSLPLARRLAGLVDLPATGHLLDVGCGSGIFTLELLRANPGWTATLLDLPAVLEIAREHVAASDLGERVNFLGGDMFTLAWPAADAVLLSDVLHNWDPSRGTDLVRLARTVLAPGGRVLLHEMLVGPASGAGALMPAGTANAVSMVATTGGRQPNAAGLAAILRRAGLHPAQTHSTSYHYSVTIAHADEEAPHVDG